MLLLVLLPVVLVLAWLARRMLPRKHSIRGMPWHPEHEFLWGSSRYYADTMMRDKTTTPANEHLRCHRATGWHAFGITHLGSRGCAVILEPQDVKHLLKTAFSNFEKAPGFRFIFAPLLGKGIFNVNGAKWKEQRIVSSHLFNRRQLRDRMSDVFGCHARQLVNLLRDRNGQSVEIQALFYNFTFDAMNSIAFNRHVNSQAGNAADCAFQQAFDACQRAVFSRFMVPWWKVNRFLQLSKEERTITKTVKIIDEYVYAAVDDALAASDDDVTLTGLFLQHAKQEGNEYPRVFIRDMILNFVIAGRDTTASGLTSCIELLTDPVNTHWQDRLQQEAAEVFGNHVNEPLTFDDVHDKAPVSEAVFLEALRLRPPVPVNEKICLKETTFPSGFTLPAGFYVGWSPISTQRMPSVWGDNAELFDPSRWITPSNTITTQYDEFMYPTFNAGPRTCLGKSMATLEAKIALLTLFAHVKFTRNPESMPAKPVLSTTWQLAEGFRVTVHA